MTPNLSIAERRREKTALKLSRLARRSGAILIVVLLVISPFLTFSAQAAEPSLGEVLDYLGFTNRTVSSAETFSAGTYETTLYAEFAGYSDENELSHYEVNTSIFDVIFTGPEGGSGYIDPPVMKSFTVDYQFGLSMLSPDGQGGTHRYFTETSRNGDGLQHAKVYENLDDPGMFLIGFENQWGGGDKDFNDIVFSIKPKQPPVARFDYSPLCPVVNETITFNASDSYDPGGSIVSYQWDFGDENITTVTDPIITHIYTAANSTMNYTVTLTVTDNDGLTNSTTATVSVTNPAILHVSIPSGEDRTKIWDPDPWLSECWLLNITGASGTFTVRIEDVSRCIWSYDTHLVVALNDAAYNNLVSLTVDSVTIVKNDFKYGTLRPYNLWGWPSGDVYPTWFNDTLVNVGTICPKGHKNVTVSVTFSNATGARMHFDAYGSKRFCPIPPTKKCYITHNPLSGDSTVLFCPPPLIPPVACFTVSDDRPNVCETVTFNATCSYDPDGTIVKYEWDWEGDCVYDYDAGSNPIATHHYDTHGTYYPKLRVTDNDGLTDETNITILVRAHPVACFTWTPEKPQVCETVYFNASCSTPDGGDIISYEWDFGDGTDHEFGMVVTHHYDTFGNYTITLNVTDSEDKWDTESKIITVRAHPHADFTWSPSSPQVGEQVTFNASASTPDGGTIISYYWDFGDSNSDSGEIVYHSYSTFGNFTVTLNVTDSEGKWDIDSKNITVREHPVANFTWLPLYPQPCENVSFDASSSTPDGGTIISYEWNFGDGSDHKFGVVVTHHYTAHGNYEVVLNVTDSEGKWDTESKTVTVRAPPQAEFEWTPTSPQVCELVTFDASASYDPDGSIVNYTWNFGDGNVTWVTAPIITHHFEDYGTYNVTLIVTDNHGKADSIMYPITVRKHPVACFTYSPAHPQVCDDVTFNASCSTPDGGIIISYTWDFGDGTPPVTEDDPITTYHYTEPDTYNITLTVTDSEGKSDTTWKTITITAPPHACFTWSPTSPQVCETVTFDASCSTPDGGVIVSYEWSFGDGDFGSGKIVDHHYSTYGTFNVTLNVTDSEGKWDIEWNLITVRAPPHAEFTFSPICPHVSETVTFDASASTPNGGTIISYEWNFGDGDSGTGKITTHRYTEPGQYNITLKVTDSEEKSDTEWKLIKVWKPPEACFTEEPATPDVGQNVTFDASCSKPGHDGSSERPITEYRWDFGDGTPIVVEYDQIAEHTYTEAGTYTVTLRVHAPPGPDACPGYEPYDTTAHLKAVAAPPPPTVGGEMILVKVDKSLTQPPIDLVCLLLAAMGVAGVLMSRWKKRRQ